MHARRPLSAAVLQARDSTAVKGPGLTVLGRVMNASVPANNEDLDRLLHAAMSDDSLELPPPPEVANEVMRLTRGDGITDGAADTSSAQLAGLIQRDVALAG